MMRFGASRSMVAFLARGRRPRYSRSNTTAPMAAAFRSAWGLCDLARRPAPSIARARQMLPARPAGSGTNDISVAGLERVGLTADEACFPRCGQPQRKTRNSSRPGSQAPHAPPALTFGLTGKQRVNWMQAGGDLMRA